MKTIQFTNDQIRDAFRRGLQAGILSGKNYDKAVSILLSRSSTPVRRARACGLLCSYQNESGLESLPKHGEEFDAGTLSPSVIPTAN